MNSLHQGTSWRNRSPEYRAGMLKKAHNAGLESMKNDVTNREYSKRQNFVDACILADVKPTKRQASKFRRGIGKAYKSKGV